MAIERPVNERTVKARMLLAIEIPGQNFSAAFRNRAKSSGEIRLLSQGDYVKWPGEGCAERSFFLGSLSANRN